MNPPGDGVDSVVCLNLKTDRRAVHVDDSCPAGYGKTFGSRSEMLDFHVSADAPLIFLEQVGDRVSGRVFEVGDEPGSRQDGRHSLIGETDPIVRPDQDRLFAGEADARRLFQGLAPRERCMDSISISRIRVEFGQSESRPGLACNEGSPAFRFEFDVNP